MLPDGKTLGDHLALMIGTVGENAILKRALCFKTCDSVHMAGELIKFAKYIYFF